MKIETTRFGDLTVGEDQVLSFPRGLIGLGDARRFTLVPVVSKASGQTTSQSGYYWLQSLDVPDLAFLVTDPEPFFKDYDVPIREETQQDLQLADTKDGRLLVICNRVGEWLTGNLLGPLFVNTATRTGVQVVLTEKTWSHRQPLVKVGLGQQTIRAAAA